MLQDTHKGRLVMGVSDWRKRTYRLRIIQEKPAIISADIDSLAAQHAYVDQTMFHFLSFHFTVL